MTDLERRYLLDTWSILVDYDGYNTVEGLKALIDETKDRILKAVHDEITEGDL